MRTRKTPRFDDDLDKLPSNIVEAARKAHRLFCENPRHPSLRIKKMQGYNEIWEGHVTIGYVFTFQWLTDDVSGESIALFRRIGKHDEVYANP